METVEEQVVTITYEVFQSLLRRVGLFIPRKLSYERWKDEWQYECAVEAENLDRRPNYVKSAMHGSLIATGKTPDEAINAVFAMMREGEIFLGRYGDYTAVIEWDAVQQLFTERKLTPAEYNSNNGPY